MKPDWDCRKVDMHDDKSRVWARIEFCIWCSVILGLMYLAARF